MNPMPMRGERGAAIGRDNGDIKREGGAEVEMGEVGARSTRPCRARTSPLTARTVEGVSDETEGRSFGLIFPLLPLTATCVVVNSSSSSLPVAAAEISGCFAVGCMECSSKCSLLNWRPCCSCSPFILRCTPFSSISCIRFRSVSSLLSGGCCASCSSIFSFRACPFASE